MQVLDKVITILDIYEEDGELLVPVGTEGVITLDDKVNDSGYTFEVSFNGVYINVGAWEIRGTK